MSDRKPNPKRKLAPPPATPHDVEALRLLAQRARYTGNPVHKRNAGDFKLLPPASARPGKTLRDGAAIFRRAEASELLRSGIERGLVSVAGRGDWPQNVWAVAPNGVALEAMLEQEEHGTYHGYPMQVNDPLADEVRRRWEPQ
jgi:hypothetical protein